MEATSRATFSASFSPHFAAAKKGDASLAERTLEPARQGALIAGVSGIPEGFAAVATARALAVEASDALDLGRADDAVQLAMLAQSVAPSDFDTVGALARVVVQTSGSATITPILVDLWRALLADPVERTHTLTRAWAVCLLTLVLVLLVVVATVALPALPLVAFELGTRLPRGVYRAQLLLFVVLVAVAPLACGLGVVVGALWVSAVALVGLSGRQRAFVGIIAASTLAMPWLAERLGRDAVRPAPQDMALFRALYDIDGDADVADIARREADGAALELHEQVALANAARRQGRIAEALERYRAIMTKHGAIPWVRGGFAVSLATAGQTQEALAEFTRVLDEAKSAPDGGSTAALAAYNASLLYFAAGETEQARAIVVGVPRLTSDLMARLRKATSRTVDEVVPHNRAFAEILPPRASVPVTGDDRSARQLSLALGVWLWGTASDEAWPILGGLVGVIVALSVVLRRLTIATRCVRCRAPTSHRLDAPASQHGACSACYATFVATDGHIDGPTRLHRENLIRRRASARARRTALLTVWPGVGHLAAGAVVRGGVAVVMSTLLIATALVWSPWWPGPGIVGVPPIVVVGACGVVWALLFLIALRSAFHVGAKQRGGAT